MERAIALNLTGWISPQDLFPENQWPPRPLMQMCGSLADAREAAEKHRIVAALAENNGQIGKTAEVARRLPYDALGKDEALRHRRAN